MKFVGVPTPLAPALPAPKKALHTRSHHYDYEARELHRLRNSRHIQDSPHCSASRHPVTSSKRVSMRPEQFAPATEISPGVAWGGESSPEHKIVPPPPGRQTCKKLLWVDDSSALLCLYQAVFESLGFEVVTTSSAGEALDYAVTFGADVVILDYDMPEMNGVQLASLVKGRNPSMPVILYSGSHAITAGDNRWVDAICAKGAPREELLTTIERLLSLAARRKPCQSQSLPLPLPSASSLPLQFIESGIAVPPSSSPGASNHCASND